jgi:hypothetical protein
MEELTFDEIFSEVTGLFEVADIFCPIENFEEFLRGKCLVKMPSNGLRVTGC